MATVREIEELALKFSSRRAALVGAMTAFREDQSEVERRHFARLRRLVVQTREVEAALLAAIEQCPHEFVKPRSVIFHGIKLGFRKSTGRLGIDDEKQTLKLIKKHLPDQVDILIETKECPVKSALQQLDVAMLRKLGCTVESTGDVAFAKPIDSEVEKALKALVKSLPDEIGEEA